MSKTAKLMTATAVAFLLGTSASNAAGDAFCNQYAATAVDQYNLALNQGIAVSGLAWNGAFDLHKAWCSIVSEDAARHEENRRQAVLDDAAMSGAGAIDPGADDAAMGGAVDPGVADGVLDEPNTGEQLSQALQDYDSVQEIYNRSKDPSSTCVMLRRVVEEMRVYSYNEGLVPESFRYSVRYPEERAEPTIGNLVEDRIHRVKQVKPACF